MAEFDIDRFIVEIETKPAIWNFEDPDYANKYVKLKAWEDVCIAMFPLFEEMEISEKTRSCKLLQRRWRSLRDCYTRELNVQQNKKYKGRPDRKPYLHFNQLSFIRRIVEKRKVSYSLDQACGENFESSPEETIETEPDMECFFQNPVGKEGCSQPVELPATQTIAAVDDRPSVTTLKRANDGLLADEVGGSQESSKRLCEEKTVEASKSTEDLEQDQDRMFLLSLLSDIKKVHEDDRLELKSEMILLVRRWQSARHNGNQSLN